jgi:PAS domain S-box-containing protein
MFKALTCLAVEHDPRLVLLAGAVCFIASAATINLFCRAAGTSGRRKMTWLATAGVAGGCGIWSTHFIAILAYKPGVPVAYDGVLTALSLIVAMATTAFGLAVSARENAPWRTAIGGTIIGCGIGVMHYIGMSALQLPGRIAWSAPLVFASLACGVLLATRALFIARRSETGLGSLGAALILTLAIVGLHFTAMAAVQIAPDPTRVIEAFAYSSETIAFGVAGATIAILALSLLCALMERRLEGQASAFGAEIAEINAKAALRLAAAVNHLPVGLCMLDADGRVVVCNASYQRVYNLEADSVRPGMSEAEIDELRRAAGSMPPKATIECPTKDGPSPGLMEETTEELPDGRVVVVSRRALPDGGSISTHQDITDRLALDQELCATRASLVEARERAEQSEQEAQAALARLRDALDAIPEGLALFDAQDRYVLWNSRYAEIYAATADQIRVGLKFEEMVRSILARGYYRDALGREDDWLADRLAQHAQRQSQAAQPMSDGRWIQVAERRTSEGGTVAVHVDITDLKRREESFRLLLEHNPVPMWVFDIEMLKFLTVNHAAVEHYQYSREQFCSMRLLDIRPKEDRAKVREAIESHDGSARDGATSRRTAKSSRWRSIPAHCGTRAATPVSWPRSTSPTQAIRGPHRLSRAPRHADGAPQSRRVQRTFVGSDHYG